MKIKFYNGWDKPSHWKYMSEMERHIDKYEADVSIFPFLYIQKRFRSLKFGIFGLYLHIEFYKRPILKNVENNQV